jgi:hypothetical protein
MKSCEKLFDGPIKLIQVQYGAEDTSITWLDIIDFARTKPSSFALSDLPNGGRVCQFWIKQCQVQISEDDYRLILSGAPERMIPTQPIADDEIAEIGTIDILEQRLAVLTRKADAVAARARQLNYHLKGRKTVIQNQRAIHPPSGSLTSSLQTPDRPTSIPFQPINSRPTSNGESQALHQDLLRQFLSDDRKSVPSRSKHGHGHGRAGHESQALSGSPGTPIHHDPNRRMSQPQATVEELSGGQYRPLMTAKNEKLVRGESIWPPCDRCRRLRMECTKYLTACTGCTKKHAKCTWNEITEEEVTYIISDANAAAAANGAAHGSGTEMAAQMESGVRVSSGGNNGGSVDLGERERLAYAEQSEGRRSEMEEEHRLLSHMASTAAAAAAIQSS